jgi:hypothetical protein
MIEGRPAFSSGAAKQIWDGGRVHRGQIIGLRWASVSPSMYRWDLDRPVTGQQLHVAQRPGYLADEPGRNIKRMHALSSAERFRLAWIAARCLETFRQRPSAT